MNRLRPNRNSSESDQMENDWMVLGFVKNNDSAGGGTGTRVTRFNPKAVRLESSTASEMIRAMLKTAVERQEGQIFDSADPISNLPTEALQKIGNDDTLRRVVEILTEIDEEDLSYVEEVINALRNGKRGRGMMRTVVRGGVGLCGIAGGVR